MASSDFAYPWSDGQCALASVVRWLSTKMEYPRMVTHLSTNLARCEVTSDVHVPNDITKEGKLWYK